jgi:hypothetical protein
MSDEAALEYAQARSGFSDAEAHTSPELQEARSKATEGLSGSSRSMLFGIADMVKVSPGGEGQSAEVSQRR